jgi:hypothetical protein
MTNRDDLRFRRVTAAAMLLAAVLALATRGAVAEEHMRRVVDDGSSTEEPPAGISVAAGDYDGDGLLDLATITGEKGVIRVTYGEPDGTVSAPQLTPAVHNPVYVKTTDLNGDLLDDLAVFSATGVLHVLLGRADRGFEAIGPLGDASPLIDAGESPDPETHPSCLNPPFDPRPHGSRNFTIDLGGLEIRDGALLRWFTDCEVGLLRFNVVRILFRGGSTERIQLNAEPVPCQGCNDSLGYAYTYQMPRHRSIHNLFIEAVLADGRLKYAGPPSIDVIPVPYP